MSRSVILEFSVTIAEGVQPDAVAEKVYDLLASDPDDLVPEIETVVDWGWKDDE